MSMHKVEIRRKPGAEGKPSTAFNTQILVDDTPLEGVRRVSFDQEVGKIGILKIEMLADVNITYYGIPEPETIPIAYTAQVEVSEFKDHRKVEAFRVTWRCRATPDSELGNMMSSFWLPGELNHPQGSLKLPEKNIEWVGGKDPWERFAKSTVSMFNAHREMIEELDQLAPRLEHERVLVSWGWEKDVPQYMVGRIHNEGDRVFNLWREGVSK